MAAAAGLGIRLGLEGLGDVVAGLRTAAGQFDSLTGSVHGTNDAVGQLRSQLTTGATAGQFGALSAQFRAIGLTAEQIPEIAHEFRERLFRDPIAVGAFGRSVIPARLGGPSDETRELREAMRMMRDAATAEQQLSLARRFQLEAVLPLVDADERHTREMEKEGARRGEMIDKELRVLRANHQAQSERLQDLRDEVALTLERDRLRALNTIGDIALPIATFVERALELAWEGFKQFTGLGALFPAANREAKADSHTDALNQNTLALRTMNRQYANAGPRAAGAIPVGLQGDALNKNLQAQAFRFGAFSVNADDH